MRNVLGLAVLLATAPAFAQPMADDPTIQSYATAQGISYSLAWP